LLRPSWPQALRARRYAPSKIAPGDFVEPACLMARGLESHPAASHNDQPSLRAKNWGALLGGEGGIRTHGTTFKNQQVAEIPRILIPRSSPESPDLALDLALRFCPPLTRFGGREVAPYLTHISRIRMLTCMRTTLIIDDDLLRRAKRRAAEWKLTVSDVVNNALRETLGRPVHEAPPFSLITYGRSGRRVHHEPSEFDAALENEDRDRLRQ